MTNPVPPGQPAALRGFSKSAIISRIGQFCIQEGSVLGCMPLLMAPKDKTKPKVLTIASKIMGATSFTETVQIEFQMGVFLKNGGLANNP